MILPIEPIFDLTEMHELFNSLSKEAFDRIPEKINSVGTFMIELSQNNKEYSELEMIESWNLETGMIYHCKQFYTESDSYFEYLYFKHKHILETEKIVKEKLDKNNINIHTNWYFSYMTTNGIFPTHKDKNDNWLRFSLSIDQPVVEYSLIYNDEKYYFPTGSSYLMDGNILHSVVNTSLKPRLMLLGAVKDTNGFILKNSSLPK
jgi:hypothetical protein